ncbi:hypothetical protein AVEN_184514-1, partial [Araneus ventricosus]
ICVISQEDGDPRIHECIQVNFQKPYRSRGTNTFVQITSVGCLTSNKGVSVGTDISPEKLQKNVDALDIENDIISSDFNVTDEEESTDIFSESEAVEESKCKRHMASGTVLSIETEPKLYLGSTRKSFLKN